MGSRLTLPTIESLVIVEDSAPQREHTAALFREPGVGLIYEASNGLEALDLLGMLVLRPSLLVIDLEMPGMDGVELIQAMSSRGFDLPFVVASSREEAVIESVQDMAQSLGLRIIGSLRKPVRREAIEQLFSTLAEQPSQPRGRQDAAFGPQDLAQAIDAGEIVPHYQPKVDVHTGNARGVEALARWMHPTLGMIAPDRFIAMAEEHQMIHALTRSMMHQSMEQVARWNARGLKLSLAVNLSPSLLSEPGIVNEIQALADEHHLPASQLILEITESSVVQHFATALGVLARLRLKGFGLSIDDFGTGFSSMQQLARIPFTELKIDRSFVNGAARKRNLRVMLQSALNMAQQLELTTVAEGIETMEDWRLLQQFGCSVGQGYLIARPMAADAITAWLRTHQAQLDNFRML